MFANVHPYDNNLELYNFLFHPLHFKKNEITTLSIITNIFITIITLGSFQILFWVVNRLDDRELEIWKKENTEKITEIGTKLLSSNTNSIDISQTATKNLDLGTQVTTSNFQTQSIQQKNEITKELMSSLVDEMSAFGEANCIFLYQAYYFPPHDPFELLIHETLDKFKFRSSTGQEIYTNIKTRLQKTTDSNIIKCEVNRSNERDMLELFCRQQEITDEGFYKNYSHPLSPLSPISMNMLLSHYFRKNENVVFLDFTGQGYLEAKKPTNKTAICSDFPMLLESEYEVTEFIQTILDNELFLHIDSRPKTILIPFSVIKPNTSGHQLLLAVEPSTDNTKKARITMVNTHGNSLDMYRSYETAALNAAKFVYNDPETVVIRNEKRLWATPSCSHNILDILLQLVNVLNIQEVVKQGLEPMNATQDEAARKKHWEDIKFFLNEKLDEAKKNINGLLEEAWFVEAKKTLENSIISPDLNLF